MLILEITKMPKSRNKTFQGSIIALSTFLKLFAASNIMHNDKNDNLQFVKLKSIGQIKCIFLQSFQKIKKATIFFG